MFVHAPSKSLILRVKDPLAIRDLLPNASKLIDAPEGNIIVRHNLETTQVLRNLGVETPSPIRTQYSWPGKYKPMSQQEVMADVMTSYPMCFNLSDMGTGKTAATLWAADYLMSIGKVKRAAIICPLSSINLTWTKDIFDVLMHRSAAVVHGGEDKRARAFNMDVDFYVINHDGIGLDDVARKLKSRKDIDLIILDEASDFRNPKTRRYKYLKWMLEKKERFWAITGTPNPNAPTDAWAMTRIVNPTKVPPHIGTFKRQTMLPISSFKWVPKHGAENIVHGVMQPAVRFAKDDCMDLPPVVTVRRSCAMTKQQVDAYAAMKDEMSMRWTSGEQVTAVNAADQINKLRQILLGVIKDPETGEYIKLDYRPRLAELEKIIDMAAAKVIIVVPFKGIIQHLDIDLCKAGRSVAVLNGDVSAKMRERIVTNFKTTPDPHILLCHPKVMSHGLNLVEADTTIFYGPIYSADQARQVVERNNRAGQTRKMTVARMACHPLEWEIYRSIDNKGIMQDNILNLYRKIIQEGDNTDGGDA